MQRRINCSRVIEARASSIWLAARYPVRRGVIAQVVAAAGLGGDEEEEHTLLQEELRLAGDRRSLRECPSFNSLLLVCKQVMLEHATIEIGF
eukprot:scaffold43543_cov20-Tisochrysis_lutea.AAC.1